MADCIRCGKKISSIIEALHPEKHLCVACIREDEKAAKTKAEPSRQEAAASAKQSGIKRLACEMCGSTDLIKQEGVFVCQNCGTKYSVEEAKKMMIDGTVEITGTVKVDNSDKLEKLLINARRARDSNNSAKAEKYYEMALMEDPESWEAIFYSAYFRAMQCTILETVSAVDDVANCIKTVLMKIKQIDDIHQQLVALNQIGLEVVNLHHLVTLGAKQYYEEIDWRIRNEYEYRERYENIIITSALMLVTLGDNVSAEFEENEFTTIIITGSYENALTVLLQFPDRFGKTNLIGKTIPHGFYQQRIDKLTRLKPSHQLPSESDVIKVYNEALESLNRVNEAANKSQESLRKLELAVEQRQQSSACYIATSVYGSRDCPQVCTLRRYRDNVLAKTWYGKTFIRFYYATSPTIVKLLGNTKWFNRILKKILDIMVEKLNRK